VPFLHLGDKRQGQPVAAATDEA